MLEGLEISIINKFFLENYARMDAEYYQKQYTILDNIVALKHFTSIGKIYKVTDGEHGSVIFYETGVKYLTAENIKKGYVDITNIRYVSNEVDKRNARARVKSNDILISIKGTLGEVAIAEDWLLPANMNRDVAILKPLEENTNSAINLIFLMSYYGKLQSARVASGAVQQMITLERLRQFYLPVFSQIFALLIKSLYDYFQSYREESKTLYQQAEDILLEELGLKGFIPTQQAVNIKSSKELFETTGRLDAEYYQPKYEEIIFKIKNYSDGFSYLKDFIKNFSTGYPYQSNTYLDNNGTPLIRINNIYKGYLDISNCAYIPEKDFLLSSKDVAQEDDILISMSGTIGNVCTIPKGVTAVINQRIMRITLQNYNNHVIALFINSVAGFAQLERIGTGGVQTNISANDIQNILIPNLSIEKQEEISALIQQSFALKSQSEKLLDIAKQAVEMAIDFDEETAMQFIKENTDDTHLIN